MAQPQTVNFFAPGTEPGLDYTQVQRQREIAKALMASAANPDPGQMVSGHYVAPGKLSYVNQIAGTLLGGLMQKRADEQERGILQKAQQQRAAETSGFMDALSGKPAAPVPMAVQKDDEGNPLPVVQSAAIAPDRAKAIAIAMQSSQPMLQSLGGELVKQQIADQRRQQILSQYGFGVPTPGGGVPGDAGGSGAVGGTSSPAGSAPAIGGLGNGLYGMDPRAVGLQLSGDPELAKLGQNIIDAQKPQAQREGVIYSRNPDGSMKVLLETPKVDSNFQLKRGPNGEVIGAAPISGTVEGAGAFAGAKADAEDAARAKRDMIKIGDSWYTRADAADSASGGRSRAATGSASRPVAPLPGADVRGSFVGTPEQVLSTIDGLNVPEAVKTEMRRAYSNQTTGNNPPFDPMGTSALPPFTDAGTGAGAGRGGQGGPGIPVQSDESKAYGTTRAKGFAEQAMGWQKASQQAASTLRNLDQLETLYRDPNVAKGALAENISGLKNIGASFGMDLKGLSSEQAAEAITNKMALESRSTADGGGMPGAMSDSDRSFLKNMQPGLTKTPEGRAQIIDAARKVAQRQIDVARLASDYEQRNGQIDAGFDRVLQDYAAKNQMFTQAKPGGGFKIIGVR